MFLIDFRSFNSDGLTINLSNVLLRRECHLHVSSLDVCMQITVYLYVIAARWLLCPARTTTRGFKACWVAVCGQPRVRGLAAERVLCILQQVRFCGRLVQR